MSNQLITQLQIQKHLNVHFLILKLEETNLPLILPELGMVVEEEQHKELSI